VRSALHWQLIRPASGDHQHDTVRSPFDTAIGARRAKRIC